MSPPRTNVVRITLSYSTDQLAWRAAMRHWKQRHEQQEATP